MCLWIFIQFCVACNSVSHIEKSGERKWHERERWSMGQTHSWGRVLGKLKDGSKFPKRTCVHTTIHPRVSCLIISRLDLRLLGTNDLEASPLTFVPWIRMEVYVCVCVYLKLKLKQMQMSSSISLSCSLRQGLSVELRAHLYSQPTQLVCSRDVLSLPLRAIVPNARHTWHLNAVMSC